MTTQNSKPEVDWVEVDREAHELSLRHGWNAHVFAAGFASKAAAAGDQIAAEFWCAVIATLTPRGYSTARCMVPNNP
jgi:hypothetical protein